MITGHCFALRRPAFEAAGGELPPLTENRRSRQVIVDWVNIDPATGDESVRIEARIDRVQGANVWLTMGLREGKNREIKRVLEHLGLKVSRLIRTSYGPFRLGDLAAGAVDEIKRMELDTAWGEERTGITEWSALN